MPSGDFYVNGHYMGKATEFQMTTGANSSSSNLVWNTWVYNGTSSTTTSDTTTLDHVWTSWTNDSTSNGRATFAVPETPEQVAAREQRQAEWLVRQEQAAADMKIAQQKAQVLLEENLSAAQRKQYQDNKWFEVITAKGTYRIRTGWAGNVDRVDAAGKSTDRYCIHPAESVPHEDNMLVQKLMLEADEETFLRIANRSTPYNYA